jgi:hypothetical protein
MIIFHEHAGPGLPAGGPFLVPMHERRENQGQISKSAIGVENMIWALRGCQQFPLDSFLSNLSTQNNGRARLIEIGYRNGGTNTFKPKIFLWVHSFLI